ncbi:uncharacterized protein Osi10b [Eurosta solidaginis]|uniref:uncharacterized protein Osi10b n=1 Tax=Eurosta solidaginis TaxID=178769 RepID=UPI003530CDF7
MPRGKSYCYLTGFNLQFLILLKCMALTLTNSTTTTTILLNNNNASIKADLTTMRYIGQALTQCLSISERWQCMELQLTKVLDAVTKDNNTWRYGDYIFIEKLPNNKSVEDKGYESLYEQQPAQRQRSLNATNNKRSITESLLQLIKSRSIRLQLPASKQGLYNLGAGISDAVDVLTLDNFVPSASALYGGTEAAQADEGRKKKNKDKTGAMMGGIALVAMIAQMFLSKVMLIAGAAFVMAKIALLVSILGSLKKGSTGGHTSTDHIVVTDHGLSGHGGYGGDDYHSAGWHRSMPHTHHTKQVITKQPENYDEHNHKPPQFQTGAFNHLSHGYGVHELDEFTNNEDGDEYRRRQTQNKFI